MIATHNWSDDANSWYVQTDGTSIKVLCTDSSYEAEPVEMGAQLARQFADALLAAASEIDPPPSKYVDLYEWRRQSDGAILRTATVPSDMSLAMDIADLWSDAPIEIWRKRRAEPFIKISTYHKDGSVTMP